MSHTCEYEPCTFVYADGRRCRSPKMPTREVCIGHWKHDGQFYEDPAAVAMLADPNNPLDTPAHVGAALAVLFKLTAQGKIPIRKATALAYIAQLLLTSMPQSRAQQISMPEALAVMGYDAQLTKQGFSAKTDPNCPNGKH